jgi:hypothetical protein
MRPTAARRFGRCARDRLAQGSRLRLTVAFILSVCAMACGKPTDAPPGGGGPDDPALPLRLRESVEALATGFGPRPASDPARLRRVSLWIAERLRAAGCEPRLERFEADGAEYWNVLAEPGSGLGEADRAGPRPPQTSATGTPARLRSPGFLIGAHYDTEPGTPGADDNASGVAVLLELARHFCRQPPAGRLRFAFFALEEMPHFATNTMGSASHARALERAGDLPAGMMSLEMLGYFSDEPDSQKFPYRFFRWLYPDRANFVAFVSDLGSRSLNRRLHRAFVAATDLPAERLSAPSFVPGVDFSDHRSFRAGGVPAVMLTDTSFYRYPHHHLVTDTPEKLDYERMAKIVVGLAAVLREGAVDGDRLQGIFGQSASSPAAHCMRARAIFLKPIFGR